MSLVAAAILSLSSTISIARAEQQTAPRASPQDAPVTGDWSPRDLPFRINLDRTPPRSLRELVDKIYSALPPERLDMFAAFHGGAEFERVRRRYPTTVSFFRDLHTIEILHEAARIWGFGDEQFPLDSTRRCVGGNFVDQVAIQIGVRRIYQQGSRRPLHASAGGYLMANRISRQLFAICDRQYSPDRTDRAGITVTVH